jgi:hypothetical protein
MSFSIPRYRITSCCDQAVITDIFNIPSSGLVTNGVYVYNGTSFEEPTTGMWFYAGYCYNIEYLGANLSSYPTAFNQADITFVSINDCNNLNCAGCEIALPEAYSVFACCDTANVVNINIDFSGCGVYTTTYKYTGPGFVTDSGFVFESEQCYNIQSIDNGVYNAGPSCEDLEPGLGSYRDCEDAITDGFCPACELGLQYLIFTNCCTEETILFKGIDANLYYGVQEYIGVPVNGLVNKCYGIEIGTVGDATVPDIAAYNALLLPPLYNAGVNFISISDNNTDCKDFIAQCPSCTIPCYTLYNCDGNNFNTTSDLSSNVGTWVTISNSEGPVAGTWLVLENTGNCKNAVNDITVLLADVTPCPINCYQITGNPTTVTYINSDKELIVQLGGGKVCSYITPIVTGAAIGYVVELGACVDGECPEICFEFTNCQTDEVLVVSNTPSVMPYYAQEQVVTLQGYDGCWSIDITEVCECPVSVTVLTAYASCPACLPIVNYKFTNCNNQSIIRYSINDYSVYVGKTVELECGECWFVSEINYTPPSTQSIVILYTFDNCIACNRNYYKLSDCLNPNVNVTYTYTDLSSYLDQVIKIKGCDTCFTVEETREPINAGIVTVTDSYIDCPECLETFPCDCTQVSNNTLEEQTYCYIDCDFIQQSIALKPGETSEKICVINWIACPSNDCNCLVLEFGLINIDDDRFYNWKLEKTALIKNGKPVYDGVIFSEEGNLWEFTLSYEFDNCWYSFFTTGNNNDADIPSFILCEDIDCPIGEWTQPECGCIDVTFTTDSFSLLLTYIDENNNYVYQDGGSILNYEISYNVPLGRWEFKDYQTDELLAYYVTSSKCPYTGTTLPVSWTVVNVSNTFSVDGFCEGDIEQITFNTTQCLQECECINMTLTVDDNGRILIFYGVLQPTGQTINGKPEYEYNIIEGIYVISWDSNTNCWLLKDNNFNTVATLCNSLNANCPIGTWLSTSVNIINAVSEFCTDGTTTVGTTTLPEYIQNFGNCINGACPVEVFPKRKVKPGYSTPSCDIEKYEKITCRSSEILYKQVMRLRYGLTNCCPEDDEKWLIKKELIDLDALRDPDYICKPTTSCCNQPITSCGCDCNSTLKTCNS